MNNNKNIKISSIDNNKNNLQQQTENMNQIDTSQIEPAYTHTMVINVRDENDNIIPTTVNLKFFFTSKNPNNVPIYAEFTKVDNDNNPVYSQNFSFTGVEDMSLPIAAAILDSTRNSANVKSEETEESSQQQEPDDDDDDDDEDKNLDGTDSQFKLTLQHYKSKASIKNTLKDNFFIKDYHMYNNFEEIFTDVSKKCSKIERLGLVACYNISADICRNYNLPVDHLYLIDKDTKYAVNILNIPKETIKSKKMGKYSVKYITISDLKKFFEDKGVTLPFESNNGYHYEMFLGRVKKYINQ